MVVDGSNQALTTMNFKKHIFLLLTIGTVLFACTKDNINPDDVSIGQEYFPLKIGNWLEYEVFYANLQSSGDDTTEYYMREVVADTFTDNNQFFYRLERFYWRDSVTGWTLDSIWSARISPTQAIRRENNNDLVKLIFPIEEGKVWDGNILNPSSRDEYEMMDLEQPFQADVTTPLFNNTLTVEQEEFVSLVDIDQRKEVYAKNVGLVYKEKKTIVIDYDPAQTPPQQDTVGQHYIQKLIDYGSN